MRFRPLRFNKLTHKASFLPGLFLISLASLGMLGCGGGSSDEGKRFAQVVDANKNAIVSTQLEANTGYVHARGSKQFNLLGTNKAGESINLTNKTIWRISDRSLGNISKNGLFTPSGTTGQLTLTAEFAGNILSQSVVISDADLVSVTVKNSAPSVSVCKNSEFSADALFNDGQLLEYPLVWSLADNSTLAAFRDANSPLLTTYKNGVVKVIAEGKNNAGASIQSAPFEFLIADNLLSVALAASSGNTSSGVRLREGQETNITVTATYTDNSTATITANASLSVDAPSAASIDASGKFIAKTGSYAGTPVTVSGVCDEQSGQLVITVLKPEINAIEIKTSSGGNNNVSLTEGSSTTLSVTATFEDAAGTDTSYNQNLEWSIDDSLSDNFDTDKISIDSSGKLEASGDLNLTTRVNLIVRVRALDGNGNRLRNRAGTELTDTINATVNPDT